MNRDIFRVNIETPCHVYVPPNAGAAGGYHKDAEALFGQLGLPVETLLGLGNTAFQAIRQSPLVDNVFSNVFVDDVTWMVSSRRRRRMGVDGLHREAGRFAQAMGDKAIELGYADYGTAIKDDNVFAVSEAACIDAGRLLVGRLRHLALKEPDRFSILETDRGTYLVDAEKRKRSPWWQIHLEGKAHDRELPSCAILDLVKQAGNASGDVHVILLPNGHYRRLQEGSVRGALRLLKEFDIFWHAPIFTRGVLLFPNSASKAVRGYYSPAGKITDIIRWSDNPTTCHVEDILRYAYGFGPSPALADGEMPDGVVLP